MNAPNAKDDLLRHLGPAVMFTIVSVIMFGLIYPITMTLISEAIFPSQAGGAYVYRNGQAVGSDIIGQLWTKPQYFQGRPSAAGSGYDPTSTGGTNLAPTSKKLIDSTKSTLAALRKENPDATMMVPMDLVTSSASGIDPDISPQAAYYQSPRIAKARGMSVRTVDAIVAANVEPRELGFLGEPRVNVLALNLALDAAK
ncbi:MAG TPA: potassium-transporting ATPase subunit KdpC [Candidatus Eremiobacteraceae bacterium]|jgi:K+-transporting ATPase ATPase C chain